MRLLRVWVVVFVAVVPSPLSLSSFPFVAGFSVVGQGGSTPPPPPPPAKTIEKRRSVLLPWDEAENDNDNSRMIGWIEEIRDSDQKTFHARVGWGSYHNNNNDDDDDNNVLVVDLPYLDTPDSLASSLWPGGMAAAILCRSPTLQSFFCSDKSSSNDSNNDNSVLELGCGLALMGLTVAAEAEAKAIPIRVVLTDNDEEILQQVNNTVHASSSWSYSQISVESLEWRDDHYQSHNVNINNNNKNDNGNSNSKKKNSDNLFRAVLSADVAYYYFLLRPLMDTVKAHMTIPAAAVGEPTETTAAAETTTNSLFLSVGQANRESQWDLYHNLRGGCYNQLTDEHEPAWPGSTQTILYRLRMHQWQSNTNKEEENANAAGDVDGYVPVAALLYQSPGLQLGPLTEYDCLATKEIEDILSMTI